MRQCRSVRSSPLALLQQCHRFRGGFWGEAYHRFPSLSTKLSMYCTILGCWSRCSSRTCDPRKPPSDESDTSARSSTGGVLAGPITALNWSSTLEGTMGAPEVCCCRGGFEVSPPAAAIRALSPAPTPSAAFLAHKSGHRRGSSPVREKFRMV